MGDLLDATRLLSYTTSISDSFESIDIDSASKSLLDFALLSFTVNDSDRNKTVFYTTF